MGEREQRLFKTKQDKSDNKKSTDDIDDIDAEIELDDEIEGADNQVKSDS